MPVEVKDLERFKEIVKRAEECRVKKPRKGGEPVKIKARTKRYLYTFKVEEAKLQEVLGQLDCKKIVYVNEGKVEERGGGG